ncbi:hypothetical protein FVEG_17018 [Fusarium verticillioides 7600]|uniref:Uncharacterized protein n=1 Tax=Gibberella moniliformis (strain M3125 / FGSC 7600) TaxID=334819 RepID=W7MY80_GIBM7|nr:hypothetical protein FVEG_17018 [Fusarium verticillioides 7600]EWG52789.1 hypothetical protein FVEG_17018 [Fusarium verticillioides 7600]
MAIRFTDYSLQNQSPFFFNVPPEVYDMVLINLFGKRRLHIECAPQPNGNARGPKASLRWTHFHCFEGHVYLSIMKKKMDIGNLNYHRGSFLLASEPSSKV